MIDLTVGPWQIRGALEGGGKADLVRLSSDFYSLIPTTTGRKAPERIDKSAPGLPPLPLPPLLTCHAQDPGSTSRRSRSRAPCARAAFARRAVRARARVGERSHGCAAAAAAAAAAAG